MAVLYPQKDLKQLIERFLKLHPNTVSLSQGTPSKTQGNNGDMQIVGRGDRVSLYVKANEKWHRFDKIQGNAALFKSLQSSTQGGNQLHILHGGCASSNAGTWDFYLPIANGSNAENVNDELDGTGNEFTAFIVPYNTKVKKVLLRATGVPGNTSVYIYKATDGTSGPSTIIGAGVSQDMSVDDTTAIYHFESVNATLSAGDLMAVRIIYTGGQILDLNYTVVLEYTNIN